MSPTHRRTHRHPDPLLRAVVVSLVLLLTVAGLVLVSPPSAAAGGGRIEYRGHDRPTLQVCKNWGTTACQAGQSIGLPVGKATHKAPYSWSDADGYYVPKGCRASRGAAWDYGPRWVKIDNLTYRSVILLCGR